MSKNNSMTKLIQVSYLIIGVLFIIIAGFFALFNQALGQGLITISLVAFGAFCLNIVVWALLNLAITSARDSQAAARKASRSPRKK